MREVIFKELAYVSAPTQGGHDSCLGCVAENSEDWASRKLCMFLPCTAGDGQEKPVIFLRKEGAEDGA